jgi:hypothetical protein
MRYVVQLVKKSPLFKKAEGSLPQSELNSVFGLEKADRWNPIRTSAIQSRSRPTGFLGVSNHEK